MRRSISLPVILLLLSAIVGCGAQPAADSAASSIHPSDAEATPEVAVPTPSETEREAPSPIASSSPAAACDLILGASDAPEGTSAGEPQRETLDDLRAEAEALEPGSPGRAAAELNLQTYQSMGLVERCVVVFGDPTGARFSSGALIFEDESGAAGYVDHLMAGCAAAELPASATIDASAIVCAAGFPVAYLVVTDGAVAQSVSASPPPTGEPVSEALLEQAVALLERMPSP